MRKLEQSLGSLGGGGHTGAAGQSGGGLSNSLLAKGVLGGIAAYSVSRMLGGGRHSRGFFGGGHHHRRHGQGFFEIERPEMDLGVDDTFEGDFGEDRGQRVEV